MEHQHTRKEFADDEAGKQEKLDFDAENLVAKAKDALKETGVAEPKNEQIMAAVNFIVGAHRKDLNTAVEGTDQTLAKTIEANLYSKEERAKLEQTRAREGVRAEYETFIDDSKLSEADALKLKEMMSEENYQLAVDAAKELKAIKIPTFEQIARELMTYTPERLKEICVIMEKPEIVIESDQSFTDTINEADENKHYTAADGKPQENTYVNSESNSPYRNLKKPGKVKIKITDGVVHPKQLDGVSTRLGERRDHLTAKYSAKNMTHISPNGMAALRQQSLIRAQKANDKSLIVDNWEEWVTKNIPGTVTFIDPSELTESTLVAYSVFYSDFRRAFFYANLPDVEHVRARGRASMQVLEI